MSLEKHVEIILGLFFVSYVFNLVYILGISDVYVKPLFLQRLCFINYGR